MNLALPGEMFGDYELWVEEQAPFSIACPGLPLDDCSWDEAVLPTLLADPIVPGSAALLDLAFVPLNLRLNLLQQHKNLHFHLHY